MIFFLGYIIKKYKYLLGRNMKLFFRCLIVVLLVLLLLLIIGCGVMLLFMIIYFMCVFNMSVENIGYVLIIVLIIGVVFSLGFGILVDKFDKKCYMLIVIVVFIVGFVVILLVNNVILVVLFFLLINCVYFVFLMVLKVWFFDVLIFSEKVCVFLLNYSFLNIGWMIGLFFGMFLVMYSL